MSCSIVIPSRPGEVCNRQRWNVYTTSNMINFDQTASSVAA